MPVVPALRIARSTGGNRAIAAAVDDVTAAVSNGSSLGTAMEEQPVFTAMVTQMVHVGEETGELDTLLTKVADQYEQDVDSTVEGLTSLLEPLLIVMMGLTVGGLLLAVYLPDVPGDRPREVIRAGDSKSRRTCQSRRSSADVSGTAVR